jgi:hypothetical protein
MKLRKTLRRHTDIDEQTDIGIKRQMNGGAFGEKD